MTLIYCIILALAALVLAVVLLVRHQRRLARRAELMQEAVRNHDFTFRLPTSGLLPGERAMQEALNQMGTTVQRQVNENEVEAWERLTRVLTHEIMNATAPIVSISQTLLGRPDIKGTALEEGLRAIHTTSQHLSTFVDSYRKFSQLQKPVSEEVGLAALVDDIARLYPDMEWHTDVGETATAHTDPTMLRQVLINLAKNAREAGAHRMDVRTEGEGTLLVSNDGQPIPAEARPSIFVPFFTTKRTGSGIGLSLSRRMMTLQGGSLELLERPQNSYHTTFQLTLK